MFHCFLFLLRNVKTDTIGIAMRQLLIRLRKMTSHGMRFLKICLLFFDHTGISFHLNQIKIKSKEKDQIQNWKKKGGKIAVYQISLSIIKVFSTLYVKHKKFFCLYYHFSPKKTFTFSINTFLNQFFIIHVLYSITTVHFFL